MSVNAQITKTSNEADRETCAPPSVRYRVKLHQFDQRLSTWRHVLIEKY